MLAGKKQLTKCFEQLQFYFIKRTSKVVFSRAARIERSIFTSSNTESRILQVTNTESRILRVANTESNIFTSEQGKAKIIMDLEDDCFLLIHHKT